MTTLGEGQAHQARTRWEQRRVNGEVGRAARESLDIDGPLVFIKAIGLEGALLGKKLDLIDELVTSVVASTWVTLRVFVRQA